MTEFKRYTVLDILRGMSVISMIVFHAMWDIVNIFGVRAEWFDSPLAFVWQQSILWGFVLLSGFCWSLGKKKIKRSLVVLAASVVISAFTAFFMPENIILFGVLTFLGTAMLLTAATDRIFKKINPYIGVFCCAVLFLFTFSIGERAVGIGDIRLFSLPDWLYRNYFTAYLGFAPNEFFSVDYVPVFPWIFLFWFGYFLYHIFKTNGFLKYLSFLRVKPMEYIGRNSLIIYIIHQPLVYALLYVWFKVL